MQSYIWISETLAHRSSRPFSCGALMELWPWTDKKWVTITVKVCLYSIFIHKCMPPPPPPTHIHSLVVPPNQKDNSMWIVGLRCNHRNNERLRMADRPSSSMKNSVSQRDKEHQGVGLPLVDCFGINGNVWRKLQESKFKRANYNVRHPIPRSPIFLYGYFGIKGAGAIPLSDS